MSWIAAAVAGGAVVGGLIQSSGSKSAANTQAQAGRDALAEQKREFDIGQANLAPYLAEGRAGLTQLDKDAGPGGVLSKPFNFDITQDPGYQFRMDQGTTAVQNSAAAKGTQLSGATLKELLQFGSSYASGEFNAAFNRDIATKQNILGTDLARVGVGSGATSTSVGAGNAAANTIGNTITGIGNATAAGQVGSSNAIGGAFSNAGNSFLLSQILNTNRNVNASPATGGALDPSTFVG